MKGISVFDQLLCSSGPGSLFLGFLAPVLSGADGVVHCFGWVDVGGFFEGRGKEEAPHGVQMVRSSLMCLRSLLTDIMSCPFSAYTRKGNAQQKEGHFRLVFSMLLDNAKFQWLAPWKRRNTSGLSICMKRQVGGFFLLYYLLFKQPEPPEGILSSEKQKLAIDPDDSRAMRFFLNDLEKLDDEGKGKQLKKEVKLAFLKLHHKGYLRKTILKNEVRFLVESSWEI